MKTKQQNATMVPNTTLNAIKNLLFSDNGVDLTSIVNDISTTQNKDLMAINIALVYKGAKIDINTETRYKYEYSNIYEEFTYLSHSIILGIVEVKRTRFKFNDGTPQQIREPEIEPITIGEWEALPNDFNLIKDSLKK